MKKKNTLYVRPFFLWLKKSPRLGWITWRDCFGGWSKDITIPELEIQKVQTKSSFVKMFQSANGTAHYLQRFPQAFQGLSDTNNFWQFRKDFQTSEMSFQLVFKDPEKLWRKSSDNLVGGSKLYFHFPSGLLLWKFSLWFFNINYMIDSGNEIKLISSMMMIIIIMMIMIMKCKMSECQNPATSVIPITGCFFFQWYPLKC